MTPRAPTTPRTVGIGRLTPAVLVLAVFSWSLRPDALAGAAPARERPIRLALDRHDLEGARRLARDWTNAQPRSAVAWSWVGRVAVRTGDGDAWHDALDRATRLGLPALDRERLEGLGLDRLGRSAEAEARLVSVLHHSLQPEPEACEVLARLLLGSYRMDPAVVVLDRWTRDAPADPRPWLWLTEIDRRSDRGPAAAIEHYREALSRSPDDHGVRRGLADALRESNRLDEAAREYERLLHDVPDDPGGRLGRGQLRFARGDLDGAAADLDVALNTRPDDPMTLRERAAVDLARGDVTTALGRLDRSLARDPFDAEARYRKSQALARLGRAADARAEAAAAARQRADRAVLLELQRAFNAAPNDLELRCRIATWMLDHGQSAQAAGWARTVLERDPAHPGANGLMARYHEARGEAGPANYHRLRARPPRRLAGPEGSVRREDLNHAPRRALARRRRDRAGTRRRLVRISRLARSRRCR